MAPENIVHCFFSMLEHILMGVLCRYSAHPRICHAPTRAIVRQSYWSAAVSAIKQRKVMNGLRGTAAISEIARWKSSAAKTMIGPPPLVLLLAAVIVLLLVDAARAQGLPFYPAGCGINDAQDRGEKYVLARTRINLPPVRTTKVGRADWCANYCCNNAHGGNGRLSLHTRHIRA